jgi:hypothetical protein
MEAIPLMALMEAIAGTAATQRILMGAALASECSQPQQASAVQAIYSNSG